MRKVSLLSLFLALSLASSQAQIINTGGGSSPPVVKSAFRQLTNRQLFNTVMTAPPVITFNQNVNPLSTGKRWWPFSSDGTVQNTACNTQFVAVSGAFNPICTPNNVFPDFSNVTWGSVNYGPVPGTNLSSNFVRLIFQYQGSAFNVELAGLTGYLFARVNGQYVAATPQTVPNDGNTYYWNFAFASSGTYEIEILAYNMSFRGLWTSFSDTVTPGALRGPKTIIMSDSYGEGTGATYASVSSLWVRAMDELNWNNYWVDAVGGTGLLANDSGLRMDYNDRFVSDVVPLAPDFVVVQMSVNDDPFTPSQLATQATALIALGKRYLPNTVFLFTGELLRFGATNAGAGTFNRSAAVQTAVIAAGGLFAPTNTTPLQATALTNSLASSATQFSTTLSLNAQPLVGGTYSFSDGTRALIIAVTGGSPWSATTDGGGIQAAQNSGATMVQVGDSPVVGNGFVGHTTGYGNADVVMSSDDTHPTQTGHDMWGEIIAKQMISQLQTLN